MARSNRRGSSRSALASACLEALEQRCLFTGTALQTFFAAQTVVGSPIVSAASGASGEKQDTVPVSKTGDRYTDGVLDFSATDLSTSGFGFNFGITRHWSNDPNYASTGANIGKGWSIAQVPNLQYDDGVDEYTLMVGTTQHAYTNSLTDDGIVHPGPNPVYVTNQRLDTTQLLTVTNDGITGDGHVIVVRDAASNTYFFHAFDSSVTSGLRGKFMRMVDASAGPVTLDSSASDYNVYGVTPTVRRLGNTVTAAYDSSNRLIDLVREYRKNPGTADTLIGSQAEDYHFNYNGTTTQVASIVLQRTSSYAGLPISSPDVIQTVDYDYNSGFTSTSGLNGTLKSVRTYRQYGLLSKLTDVDYYRYWDGDVSGTTLPGGLKLAFDTASYSRLSKAFPAGDHLTESDITIQPYASAYYEYGDDSGVSGTVTFPNTINPVTKAIIPAEGASGSNNGFGTYEYTYVQSSNIPYTVNTWVAKTIESLPDGSEEHIYTNASGQEMLDVHADSTLGLNWGTFYRYNDDSKVMLVAQPSAVNLPSESTLDATTDLMGYNSSTHNYAYLNDSTGPIDVTNYFTATDFSLGEVAGSESGTALMHGDMDSSPTQLTSMHFNERPGSTTGVSAQVNNDNDVADSTTYIASGQSGTTSNKYDTDPLVGNGQITEIEQTLPTVGTGENGSGLTEKGFSFIDDYGRVKETESARGVYTDYVYDPMTGAVTSKTVDPSGLDAVTSTTVDVLGRPTKITDPDLRSTYFVYRDFFVDTNGDGYVGSGDDFSHEMRTYPGWTGSATTGLTQVQRDDFANGYSETLSMSATPTVSSGVPTGAEDLDDVHSLERQYTNKGGELIQSDSYVNPVDLTYTIGSITATVGTDLYRTTYGYDSGGRLNLTVGSTGTYYKTVYDSLGRPTATYVGTSDSNLVSTSASVYDGGGVGDSDLTEMTDYTHDGVNDRVTESAYDWRDRIINVKSGVLPAGASYSNLRSIGYAYDNADDLTYVYQYGGVASIASGSPTLVGQAHTDYDDRGRPFEVDNYNVISGTAGSYLSSGTWYDGDDHIIKKTLPNQPTDKYVYDKLGRVQNSYTSDATDDTNYDAAKGVSGDHVLTESDNVYSPAGDLLSVRSAERGPNDTSTGVLTDNASNTHKDRNSYAEYWYDNSHRVVTSVDYGNMLGHSESRPTVAPTRSDSISGTVSNYELTISGGVPHYSVSVTSVAGGASINSSDVGYSIVIASQSFTVVGVNGSVISLSGPLSPDVTLEGSGDPIDAAFAITPGQTKISTNTYNDADQSEVSTDPKGLATKTKYDGLGRTTDTIENYNSGSSTITSTQNRTTHYQYDGNNNVTELEAVLPFSAFQKTNYVYGVTNVMGGTGSGVNSNDLLYKIEYPTKTGGSAGSPDTSNPEVYKYNALGDESSYQDRNGTTHVYRYDVLDRLTTDDVTGAVGSGVDTAVEKLGYTYNTRGQNELYTSYNASGAVVNQVEDLYNGYSQLATEYQENGGAVNTGTSASVQYTYDSTAANTSRLSKMTYPNGRVIDYDYGSSGSLNDAISRIDSICDENNAPTADILEQYTYLGADTEVGRNRPEDSTDMLLYTSSGSGDGLTGLDRYGRITTLNWANTSTSGSTDQFSYTYDLDDNRLTRTNGLNSAYNEQYTYDNLNRLTDMKRGSSFASPSYQQTWTLDALGNATNLDTTVSGTTTSTAHAFNSQNQISDTGTTYDSNGNQQTLSDIQTGTYDAWNRLVKVDIANDDAEGSHGMKYTYDALGRRIGEASYGVLTGTGTADSASTRYYYDNRWQVIQEEGLTLIHGSGRSIAYGDKIATYVWSPGYVDELIERDVVTPEPTITVGDPIFGSGLSDPFDAQNIAAAPDGRVYAQQDANYNVTALIGDTDPATSGTQWGVVERYAYAAYGDPTFVNASFSPLTNSDGGTTSAYDFNVLNQGTMYDPNADLYHVRFRVISSAIGRWVQQDGVGGYEDGNSLYTAEVSNEIGNLDPSGALIPRPPDDIPPPRNILQEALDAQERGYTGNDLEKLEEEAARQKAAEDKADAAAAALEQAGQPALAKEQRQEASKHNIREVLARSHADRIIEAISLEVTARGIILGLP